MLVRDRRRKNQCGWLCIGAGCLLSLLMIPSAFEFFYTVSSAVLHHGFSGMRIYSLPVRALQCYYHYLVSLPLMLTRGDVECKFAARQKCSLPLRHAFSSTSPRRERVCVKCASTYNLFTLIQGSPFSQSNSFTVCSGGEMHYSNCPWAAAFARERSLFEGSVLLRQHLFRSEDARCCLTLPSHSLFFLCGFFIHSLSSFFLFQTARRACAPVGWFSKRRRTVPPGKSVV